MQFYNPETADELLQELEATQHLAPDYRKVYSAMSMVFNKCINQQTEAVKANLCGTFAKTDYLLKEHHASKAMQRSTNDTRVRLRKRCELPEETLKEHCREDYNHLRSFILLIYNIEGQREDTAQYNATDIKEVTDTQYFRMIVDHWDTEYVYGPADNHPDTVTIHYASVDGDKDRDWSYLHDLFYPGAQLNVISPRLTDGIIHPELIIFEPDYLVDISMVARCFTNYSESPLTALLNRLQPQQNSEAIVLGNFAGQMLDETICPPEDTSYNASVKRFFRNNAVSLLTAGVSPNFHNEARLQQTNIRNAINTSLPATVSSFSSKDGMVEPSFFSEMLGLQGRMDYLQLDFRVLMEQKSGKGEFPYDNFTTPRHREEHYVQLLLYMLLIRYNYHSVYESNNRELHAFLLYTKYTNSLLGLGFAPQLTHRALKVRNTIAHQEMTLTKEGEYRHILENLTPEMMNTKGVCNNLWKLYQSKQLHELLAPIRNATETERAYYFRMLTFTANEHVLSKLGNKTKDNSGFASKWHSSLEEKLAAGNIYCNLTLLSPDKETTGSIETVTLRFQETEDNDMSNFRTGDIVILYPYNAGHEPDARQTMVFRCTIDAIGQSTIHLTLRAAQSDSRVFLSQRNKLWAIEHDFFESSYSGLYRGIHAFLSAPKERRDLLMLQRAPEIDTSITLKGDYGQFNDLALRLKRNKDLFLIIGPPGTGKTSFGMLNTVKEELLEPDSSVLLLSYTNRAVDEICGKLTEAGIDFIRVGSVNGCAEEYRDNLLTTRAQHCDNLLQLTTMLSSMRVYTGTTTSFSSHTALFQLRQFSLAVIDEASQILEPHLLGILCTHNYGIPAIRKIVMIGDHKQLPAVVQQTQDISAVKEPLLHQIHLTDCRLSLFERLLSRYRDNEDVVYMLCRQGRMHHDIAQFPNTAFYNSRLMEVPLPHQIAPLSHPLAATDNALPQEDKLHSAISECRISFIAAEPPQNSSSDKVNQTEADIIANAVLKIYNMEKNHFSPTYTVGVIVPYRNQIATIRSTIATYGIPALQQITIDTVERYQGSQRRYIIYGLTVSKYYQLKFLTDNVFLDTDGTVIDRKLNVAMTRAMEHLIIVGNPTLLGKNDIYANLINFIKERGGYFTCGKYTINNSI